MSYERDADRASRGVGAIAAADMVSPARHRARVRSGLATRVRDRKMAAIGKGALGMIALPTPTRTRTTGSGTAAPTSSKLVTVIRPRTPSTVPGSNVITALPVNFPQSKPSPKPITTLDPTMLPPRAPGQSPPIIALAPLPPLAPLPTSTTSPLPPTTSTVITTSGGGKPTASTGSGGIMPPLPGGPTTITMPPLIPDAIEDNTVRNLALVGGAALLAYLFFRRPA